MHTQPARRGGHSPKPSTDAVACARWQRPQKSPGRSAGALVWVVGNGCSAPGSSWARYKNRRKDFSTVVSKQATPEK